MKPEAFLPSNLPGSASAAPIPPVAPAPATASAAPKPKVALSPAEYDKWAADFLRNNRNAPRAHRLELIKWRHAYQLQQEAAEQQGGTAAAEDLRRAAERLARKAQSGFVGPVNLPSNDSL